MIYHIFNGKLLHAVPSMIKNILSTSSEICKDPNTKHCFCLIMFGKDMLYKNVISDPYSAIFEEYKHNDYVFLNKKTDYIKLLFKIGKKDKVIYHSAPARSLFFFTNIVNSMVRPFVLHNSSFICWGAGEYRIYDDSLKRHLKAQIRRFIFNRFANIITLSTDDENEARKMYPSANVFLCSYIGQYSYLKKKKHREKFHVMVSHSGWPHNYHRESFGLLEKYVGKIEITCPLCYGDPDYIESVIRCGKEIFGEDFHYFKDLLSKEDYGDLFSEVDAYVTYTDVQTGLGAISNAIRGGAKIFVRANLYNYLVNEGFHVQDVDELKILSFEEFKIPLTESTMQYNVDVLNKDCRPGNSNYAKWQKVYEE